MTQTSDIVAKLWNLCHILRDDGVTYNEYVTELTFLLTSGGHNAGIISEPGHPHRHFRIRVRDAGGRTLGPDEWERDTSAEDGSWWLEWNAWLDRHSGGRVDPPPMGAPGFMPLCDAPGTYVLER